jgi:hypothetical protein
MNGGWHGTNGIQVLCSLPPKTLALRRATAVAP